MVEQPPPASRLFTSDVVVGEASEGDDEAARQRLDALQGIEELETTPEAEDLASALLEKGPLPESSGKGSCRCPPHRNFCD